MALRDAGRALGFSPEQQNAWAKQAVPRQYGPRPAGPAGCGRAGAGRGARRADAAAAPRPRPSKFYDLVVEVALIRRV